MFRLARQLLAMARATFVESVQQPAALLLTLAGVVATALIPLLQFYQFGEPGRLERDGGLAYQLLFGLILAVSAASSALHGEIVRGTAAAALSKPVGRGAFVVAKFLGVLALVGCFWFCLLCATLLAERGAERYETIGDLSGYFTDGRTRALLLLATPLALLYAGVQHLRRRARFGVAAFQALTLLLTLAVLAAGCYNHAGEWDFYHLRFDWRIVPAALLVLAALLFFTALATALATRLKPAPTLAICVLVLGGGLAADAVQGGWRLFFACLPNVQHFWLCDALARGGRIPASYLPAALAYAAAWSGAVLGLGVLAFHNRDLD